MFEKFSRIIKQKFRLKSTDRILLAVSGGRDSMAMVALFFKSGIETGVAHFNHVTREGESDRDEEFVRNYCKDRNLIFFSERTDIRALTHKGEGNNFHDIAHKYRYKWLEKIRSENGYTYVATAHNQDDQTETFLYKASKGSGIYGLSGIKSFSRNIIRPMLDISRDEIDNYIKSESIPFIEDSSNAKIDYDRNFIRHKIIPEFKKLHPDFNTRLNITIHNLHTTSRLYQHLISEFVKPFITYDNNWILIDKKLFEGIFPREELLFQVIYIYGFNNHHCADIIRSLDRTGACFQACNHRLVIERDAIIIQLTDTDTDTYTEIPGNGVFMAGNMQISVIEMKSDTDFSKVNSSFHIDADKVKFPLTLRDWIPGDRFCPFGLKGKSTKLKKYLTGKKVLSTAKNHIKVLESDGKIVFVEGIEIAYHVRITDQTKRVFFLEIKRQ